MKSGLEIAQDEMDKACNSFKQMQSKEDASVYAKEIWNAAIEAAALEATNQEYGHEAAYEIRKLKK